MDSVYVSDGQDIFISSIHMKGNKYQLVSYCTFLYKLELKF